MGSRKKRPFYGQADRKGGGAAPLALTLSWCENLDPLLALKVDSLILKTHFTHLLFCGFPLRSKKLIMDPPFK